MLYATRDENGRLVGLSEVPLEDGAEIMRPGDPDVVDFLTRVTAGGAMVSDDPFLASDLDFIRVIEDLVEVLLKKGILTLADLPEAARDKLMERRAMRHAMGS